MFDPETFKQEGSLPQDRVPPKIPVTDSCNWMTN